MKPVDFVLFAIVFILIIDNYRLRYQIDKEMQRYRKEGMTFHRRTFHYVANIFFDGDVIDMYDLKEFDGTREEYIDAVFVSLIPEIKGE